MHGLEHHHVKFARTPLPSSEMIHNFRPWAAELVHMVRTKTDRSTDLLHRATCYRQRKCKLGPGRGPCSLHRCESSSSLLLIQQLAFGCQGGKELDCSSVLPVSIDTKFGRDKPLCFPCMWCPCPVVVLLCTRGTLFRVARANARSGMDVAIGVLVTGPSAALPSACLLLAPRSGLLCGLD